MSQRYRLIPGRGLSCQSRFVWGDLQTVRAAAEECARELRMPIVVCEHPEGGYSRHLFTVPGPESAKATRRAA